MNPASAISLDSLNAGNLTLQQALGYDLGSLGLFNGNNNSSLNISASVDQNGFTANISGLYLGKSLNVNYTGNSSNFGTNGQVSWTSSGSLGSNTWSGGGTNEISLLSTDQWQSLFSSLDLNVGANTSNFANTGTNFNFNTSLDQFSTDFSNNFGTGYSNGTEIHLGGSTGNGASIQSKLLDFGFGNLNVGTDFTFDNGITRTKGHIGSTFFCFSPCEGSGSSTYIPEPLTILGIGTALGMGAFFKRQQAKKQEKEKAKLS